MNVITNIYITSRKSIKYINKLLLYRCISDNVPSLNEASFVGRIVHYLNDYNKTNKNVNVTPTPEIGNILKNLKANRINTLNNLKEKQIEELLLSLRTPTGIIVNWEFQKVIDVIDDECCSRINVWDVSSLLKLLNIYVQVIPNQVATNKFFHTALTHISKYIEYLNKEEILQFIFYVGLPKGKSKSKQAMLKACLKQLTNNDIKALSIEELCIICNATFRSSTKISNVTILEKILEMLNENLYLLKDPALLVTLLKTVRHNRYQDDDLLNTLSCAIMFNRTIESYNFMTLCHVMALFADHGFYHGTLLKLFVNECLKYLQVDVSENRQHVSEEVRPKDITRFLWILSTLGYDDDYSIFEKIVVPNITHKIDHGAYKNDVDELINSVLYLWMLNYQAVTLLPIIFTQENIDIVKEQKSKVNERMNLLLTCLYFENRAIFKTLRTKPEAPRVTNLETHICHRPSLLRVHNALKSLTPFMDVDKYELNFQVPHLNVCGITGYKKKIYKHVHVEVFDEYVRLKNTEFALVGSMKLKMRILNGLDEAVITVREDDIRTMPESELREYLRSELELVC